LCAAVSTAQNVLSALHLNEIIRVNIHRGIYIDQTNITEKVNRGIHYFVKEQINVENPNIIYCVKQLIAIHQLDVL
jgi:hypothetical protein